MTNSFIKIRVLELEYNDTDIHFELSASNGECSSQLDFYGYANEFKTFGKQLADFPFTVKEVKYETGSQAKGWAYYLCIRAFCYDLAGKSAIEIITSNPGSPPYGYRCDFSIQCEAASINRLGESLARWEERKEGILQWDAIEER